MRASELESASIVMVGSFNPAIFQPRWLGSQGLIRQEEADDATIRTIQAEVADFSTEWLQLQVLQKRFQVSTVDARHYGPLRDLASSMFSILPHTPVTMLGMNRDFHFKMSSRDIWNNFGHLLAPKDVWNKFVEEPGLRTMTMQCRRPGIAEGGKINVKIEPSARIEYGIFFQVNEEYRTPKDSEQPGSQWVPQRLAEHWDPAMAFAEGAIDRLLHLAGN